MDIIEIVILIISVVCFFEWHELNKNSVRHDEKKFFVIGVIMLIIFFILIYMGQTVNTLDE